MGFCFGAIAQLGERLLCKQEVVGSIPSGSTNRNLIDGDTAMAVPKRKTTPSKRGMRRAHDAIKADAYIEDKTTGELHRPHHMDLKSGMYRGRQVMKVKDRI